MFGIIKWKKNEKINSIEWWFILVWTKRSISKSGIKEWIWNPFDLCTSMDYGDWSDVKRRGLRGIWKWLSSGVLENINWENKYRRKIRERELWGERGTTTEITQGMDFSSPSPTAHHCPGPYWTTSGHHPRKRGCWRLLPGSRKYLFDDQKKKITLFIWKAWLLIGKTT